MSEYVKKHAIPLALAAGATAVGLYFFYQSNKESAAEKKQLASMKSYKKRDDVSDQKYAAVKAATKDESLIGKFTARELEKIYDQVFELNSDGKIGRVEFEKIFQGLGITDTSVISSNFRAWDINGDGLVSYSELLHVLATMTAGTPEEKLELLFKAYDLDQDGFLTRNEMCEVLQCHLAATRRFVDEDEVKSCVNDLFRELDKDHNGVLTKEEFLQAAYRDDVVVLDSRLLESFGLSRTASGRTLDANLGNAGEEGQEEEEEGEAAPAEAETAPAEAEAEAEAETEEAAPAAAEAEAEAEAEAAPAAAEAEAAPADEAEAEAAPAETEATTVEAEAAE